MRLRIPYVIFPQKRGKTRIKLKKVFREIEYSYETGRISPSHFWNDMRHKLGVASSNYEGLFAHIKQSYGLEKFFDFTFSSSGIGFKSLSQKLMSMC